MFHHARNIDRDRFAELSGTAPTQDRADPLEEWILRWMEPAAPPADRLDTLPGLIHHVTDAWERRGEPNIVLAHYRDLTDDTEDQMRLLARRLHIGVPDELLPRLAAAASFTSMKRRAQWLGPDRLGVLVDADAFFRSGRSGEGERVLDEPARHRYDRCIGELTTPEIRSSLEHGGGPKR